MPQTALPDDPMENEYGSRYLRLTRECPKQGIVLSLEKPTKGESRFKDNSGNPKQEYQWPCTQYLPAPVEKTLVESSPGFCSALKSATKGQPYGKILHVRWTKTLNSRSQPMKEWSIRELTEADVAKIFSEG